MRNGFTLVETMVVIAVTLLMSTMLLTYNRSAEKQIALFKDQAVIVGVLNRAKALAIERFSLDPQVCAFGVHFEGNSQEFILFQDLQPAGDEAIFGCRESGIYNSNLIYDAGEEIERLVLDSRLQIKLRDKNDTDLGNVSLVFVPPEISVKATADLPITIVVEVIDSIESAAVTVGEIGQITVD